MVTLGRHTIDPRDDDDHLARMVRIGAFGIAVIGTLTIGLIYGPEWVLGSMLLVAYYFIRGLGE